MDLDKYFDNLDKLDNNCEKEKDIKCYLEDIYISPALDNVKINLNKNDKILAIGYDEKQRAQYVYNKKYITKKSKEKFKHMIDFGESYQKMLQKINKDLIE